MGNIYNIYCDESCHLENDHQTVAVIGAVWCPLETTREISVQIREIKKRNGMSPEFESKWTKVSPGGLPFYLDLIDYFFNNPDLSLRTIVVPDKSKLRHGDFRQNHDDWYYKMYYNMLKAILDPDNRYRIYLDYKDTWGGKKVKTLHSVLCNQLGDSSKEIIERIQIICSREVEIIQLTDLLIGAVAYANRRLEGSTAKLEIVREIEKHSKRSLTRTTPLGEKKVNIFLWEAQEKE